MHKLEFKLENPVVEGMYDHVRQLYHVVFDGTLMNGAIRTDGEINKFLVTVHPPEQDKVAHAAGITVETKDATAATVDVTLDGAIVHRLMNVRADEEVTLFLRFAKGGTRDPERGDVFESTADGSINWLANKIRNVPYASCRISVKKPGPGAVTADSLHIF